MRTLPRVLGAVALAVVMVVPQAAASDSAGAAVPPLAEDCWSSDNGNPVITAVALDADTVDVRGGPASVTVRVRTYDTGGPGPTTGVQRVTVWLNDGEYKADGPGVLATLHNDGDGWWSGSATFPAVGANSSVWVLSARAVDYAGNAGYLPAWYDTDRFPAPPPVRIIRPAEVDAPHLRTFRVTPLVDVRRRAGWVVMRAHVVDRDAASTASVVADDGTVTSHRPVPLRLVRGTPNDGWWSAHLRVPRGSADGRQTLRLELTDRNMVVQDVSAESLKRRGLDWRYVVRSRPDTTAPRVSVLQPPGTVDLEADVTAEVRVHVVAHKGAGVRSGELRRLADDRTHWVRTPFRRESGTHRDGVWVARLPLLRCGTRPGTEELTVSFIDRVGNARDVPVVATVVGGDHRGPVVTVSGYGGDVDYHLPLRVAFDEPAYGIGPESLQLWQSAIGSSGLCPNEPDGCVRRVPGNWSCTAPSGQAVDCLNGPVASVVLETSEQPVQATAYEVRVNPEGNLGLRDGAGNPAQPQWSHGWFVGWPPS